MTFCVVRIALSCLVWVGRTTLSWTGLPSRGARGLCTVRSCLSSLPPPCAARCLRRPSPACRRRARRACSSCDPRPPQPNLQSLHHPSRVHLLAFDPCSQPPADPVGARRVGCAGTSVQIEPRSRAKPSNPRRVPSSACTLLHSRDLSAPRPVPLQVRSAGGRTSRRRAMGEQQQQLLQQLQLSPRGAPRVPSNRVPRRVASLPSLLRPSLAAAAAAGRRDACARATAKRRAGVWGRSPQLILSSESECARLTHTVVALSPARGVEPRPSCTHRAHNPTGVPRRRAHHPGRDRTLSAAAAPLPPSRRSRASARPTTAASCRQPSLL